MLAATRGMAALTQNVGSLSGDVKSLTGNVNKMAGKVDTLTGNVDNLTRDVTTLTGEMTHVKATVQSHEKSLSSIKGTVQLHDEEISSVKAGAKLHEEKMSQEIDSLKSLVQSQQNKTQTMDEEMKAMKKALDAKDGDIEAMTKISESKLGQLVDLLADMINGTTDQWNSTGLDAITRKLEQLAEAMDASELPRPAANGTASVRELCPVNRVLAENQNLVDNLNDDGWNAVAELAERYTQDTQKVFQLQTEKIEGELKTHLRYIEDIVDFLRMETVESKRHALSVVDAHLGELRILLLNPKFKQTRTELRPGTNHLE